MPARAGPVELRRGSAARPAGTRRRRARRRARGTARSSRATDAAARPSGSNRSTSAANADVGGGEQGAEDEQQRPRETAGDGERAAGLPVAVRCRRARAPATGPGQRAHRAGDRREQSPRPSPGPSGRPPGRARRSRAAASTQSAKSQPAARTVPTPSSSDRGDARPGRGQPGRRDIAGAADRDGRPRPRRRRPPPTEPAHGRRRSSGSAIAANGRRAPASGEPRAAAPRSGSVRPGPRPRPERSVGVRAARRARSAVVPASGCGGRRAGRCWPPPCGCGAPVRSGCRRADVTRIRQPRRAAGRRPRSCRRAVDHPAGDGEAEAGAAAGRPVAAGEPVEDPGPLGRRDARRPRRSTSKHHLVAVRPAGQPHRAAGGLCRAALSSRLARTWCSRAGSASTVSGRGRRRVPEAMS